MALALWLPQDLSRAGSGLTYLSLSWPIGYWYPQNRFQYLKHEPRRESLFIHNKTCSIKANTLPFIGKDTFGSMCMSRSLNLHVMRTRKTSTVVCYRKRLMLLTRQIVYTQHWDLVGYTTKSGQVFSGHGPREQCQHPSLAPHCYHSIRHICGCPQNPCFLTPLPRLSYSPYELPLGAGQWETMSK